MSLQIHSHETTGRALVNISILVSAAVGVLALLLVGISAVLGAFFFGLDFILWSSVVLLGGAGLLIAALLLMGWENARWVIVEPIAAHVEKIRAEADAIKGGANVIHQNISTTASGKAKVAINAPVVQENIRLIPMSAPGGKLIEGLPAPAICFFIDQYDVRGWGQRAWVDCGMRIPGLQEPVDYDTWRQLVAVIEKVGGIPPVKERTKIKPVLDLQVIKSKALGPGIVPAEPSAETA